MAFRTLSASLVFPAFAAVAANYIFGHLASSEGDRALIAHCSAGSNLSNTPYLLPYTGNAFLDAQLCPLVAFFHEILDNSTSYEFLRYFAGISSPWVLVPFVESLRPRRSAAIAYPSIYLNIAQRYTIGLTLPIYWLAYILTGNTKNRRVSSLSSITVAQAYSIIFAFFIGATVRTAGLLLLKDATVTALWQPYPIWITLAYYLHLYLVPKSWHSQSGVDVIQSLYIASFILSSSIHIAVVWPILRDTDAIKALLIPSLTPLSPSLDLAAKVHNLLKWDGVMAFTSAALATLWFSSGLKQVVAISIWYAFAIPVLGFGAAFMGVVLALEFA